jgi:hypothetical protein
MEETQMPQADERQAPRQPALPEYAPPRVVTYHGQEIQDELGPAQACSFVHSVILC